MQLTITTDYAIRIVCYLAKKQQMTSAAELAQELQIPISYIPKVTRQLKRKHRLLPAMEGHMADIVLIKKQMIFHSF
ncbi:MAG: Rrf2 family transcriptional regulator [Eubacterium ramulus]